MKILFACGAGCVYGKEIITLSLMESLRERGHEVHCITSTWGAKDFMDRLEDLSLPHDRIPLGFISKTRSWSAIRMTLHQLSKLPTLWLSYRRIINGFQPDAVIHTNLHHIFLLLPILDRHRTFFHVHEGFLPTEFYRRIFKLIERKIRGFIAVSEFINLSIRRREIPATKVFTVLNGIEESSDHSVSTVPKKRGINIGIVGQVGQWKGHEDLIEALRLLRTDLQFNCSIFGNGDEEFILRLRDRIDEYGLSPRVNWVGFCKDRTSMYSNIDICVIPSRSEDPCPTVALEAAHFGIPIIATRRGGLPELVNDGDTGFLVDKERPDKIAEKIELLIRFPDLRYQQGSSARAFAREFLTLQRMTNQFETILLKAM